MSMLKMEPEQAGSSLTLQLGGRLDTATAPELDQYLQEHLDGVQALALDFAALDYLSSAGLRVLLKACKQMNSRHGSLVVRHVNDMIQEVFDMTGFSDILTIEK